MRFVLCLLVCLAKKCMRKAKEKKEKWLWWLWPIIGGPRAAVVAERLLVDPPPVQCHQRVRPRENHQRWSQPGHSKSDFGGGGVGIGEGLGWAAGGAAMGDFGPNKRSRGEDGARAAGRGSPPAPPRHASPSRRRPGGSGRGKGCPPPGIP